MPIFDSLPVQRVLREFTVSCYRNGRWIAAEAHGLPGRGVRQPRRFALWEADRDPARVHVETACAARHD